MNDEAVITARRPGRTSKRTPENAALLCEMIGKGIPITHALAVLPMSFQCYADWKESSAELRERLAQAIANGVNRRLEIIERAAAGGEWRAAAWLLEHTQPEHFSKTRVEHAHVHVGNVTQTHEFVVPAEILNQIADARKKHEETERQ